MNHVKNHLLRVIYHQLSLPISIRSGINCKCSSFILFDRVQSVLQDYKTNDINNKVESGSFEKSTNHKPETELNQNSNSINEETPNNEELVEDTTMSKEYCYFCHGTDNLAKCTGPCGRSYHLVCIGMKASPRMNTWKCRACRGNELKSSDSFKKHCLRNWYFKCLHPIESGNTHSIILEGNTAFNGEVWKCSPISRLIDSTHIITTSGSIYVLLVGS